MKNASLSTSSLPAKLFLWVLCGIFITPYSFAQAPSREQEKPKTPRVEALTRKRPKPAPIRQAVIEEEIPAQLELPAENINTPLLGEIPASIAESEEPAPSDSSNANSPSSEYWEDESNTHSLIEETSSSSPLIQAVPPTSSPDKESIKQNIELSRQKEVPFKATSRSNQFIVTGINKSQSISLCSTCEEIKTQLLDFLKEKDEWKGLIVISLIGKYGDPIPSGPLVKNAIHLIGGVPTFTLTVHIGKGLDDALFRSKITETLIYERALRRIKPDLIPTEIQVPTWLVFGMHEALEWKRGTADKHLYSMLFERGEILSLENIFKIKSPLTELDASSRGVFNASCGALVLCLLNQGGGNDAFKNLLDKSLFSDIEPELLLKQHFPGLHLSKNSLHKWWSLQLAGMATQPLTESLSILASEARLAEILTVPYFNGKEKLITELSPEHYYTLLKLPQSTRQNLLQPVLTNLLQISYRVFPTQRSLVISYITIIESLIEGKPLDNWQKELAKLAKQRQEHLRAGERSRDYIDWFSIVTASKTSGNFDSYRRTMEILRAPKPRPKDNLTEYLDDIEKLIAPNPIEND